MQEIRESRRENGVTRELIDRLVGRESPELIRKFTARREALEARLQSGETTNATITEARRIGRNDPCPCGSKVKFKKCCGSKLAEDDPRVND